MVTLEETDVKWLTRDQSWKHPPTSAGYTPEEVEDIIGYVRCAATGNVSVVRASKVGANRRVVGETFTIGP